MWSIKSALELMERVARFQHNSLDYNSKTTHKDLKIAQNVCQPDNFSVVHTFLHIAHVGHTLCPEQHILAGVSKT